MTLQCLLVQVMLLSQLKMQVSLSCVQSLSARSSDNLSNFCGMLCTEASYRVVTGCLQLPELAGTLRLVPQPLICSRSYLQSEGDGQVKGIIQNPVERLRRLIASP